jgi:carbonic anhydrase
VRIDKFLVGHEKFKQRVSVSSGDLLKKLVVEGQRPEALVICCSDSRVIPELIMGAEPGNLFVVRNVANLIPTHASGDPSVGAAIAYAIEYLHVSHLIVLGHYGCGGMAALRGLYGGEPATHAPAGPLTDWLAHGRASWDELLASGHAEDADWHERLVEENVLQQLAHAIAYPVVREAAEAGELVLHAWCYDMKGGQLRFWDIQTDAFVSHGMAAVTGGTVTIGEIERQDQVK